ncbi:flagellar basal-body MS-ring/collar protein FliF [Limnoglobus roseus]|uniref:Flagellar M-ring protein n=1 Tax=Limnoglobus roseus TaxID=2598579 RepID=A0A5C1A2I5_9BACT|nr:flagellar basal-body MS-ring/collar protein FliF [Limnoglobus roseus]QEL13329.1 flagellar M-ring protein FliF [Limnoglobus roseus]
MDPLQRLLTQLRTFWSGLGTLRKVLLVSVTLLVFAALAAFSILSTGTAEYTPLVTNQALEDVQPIVTKLNALAIPNKLINGGTGVSVPYERHAEAKVALAADNLPARGGKGYELFDSASLGATPFTQNVNYQRAIQTELARMIMKLAPVESAQVMIARPEPTPFVRDQRPPTASVVLKLKPNMALAPSAAAGIVAMVAGSVDGLKAENVTVLDAATGLPLSDPHARERDQIPAAQIEYRRSLEEYLAKKAEDMLNKSLGLGRAVIRVSADINFQRLKERQETFSPDGKVVIAERNTTSQSTTPPRGGGVTGARSNIAPAGGISGGGGSGNSKEEVLNADYVVSKTVRELEGDRAVLQRLNIAAMIDLTPAEGQPAPTMTVADAEAIIQQAVGFTANRDQIKVSNVRLTSPIATAGPTEAEEEAAKLAKIQTYVSLARNISLAVAVALALALVPLTMLRRRARPAPTPAADETSKPPPEPTPEERRQQMLDRLKELARTDPDRVAEAMTMLAGAKS